MTGVVGQFLRFHFHIEMAAPGDFRLAVDPSVSSKIYIQPSRSLPTKFVQMTAHFLTIESVLCNSKHY